MIPYALILHCVTSYLFLAVEDIFPTQDSYGNILGDWEQINWLRYSQHVLDSKGVSSTLF